MAALPKKQFMKTLLPFVLLMASLSATTQTTRLDDLCQVFHLPDGLRINTPLYIAYETADKEIAPSLDYLPLDFIEKAEPTLR